MSEQSGFQISGNAAELYERYAVPYMMGPWAPGLVETAALRRGERVLDLACGVPAGRVLLSVWKSAGPYNVAVGEALERHVGGEAAIAALSEDRRTALAKQVKVALERYADGDDVVVPDEIYLAIAHT